MDRRVVVTGMGVVSPNGVGLEDFEQAIRQGRPGIRLIPRLEELNFACRIGGVPENFEQICGSYFNAHQQTYMSDIVRYAAVAAMDAWRDAGLAVPTDEDPPDWESGAIFGSGISDLDIVGNEVVPKVNDGKVKRLGTRVVERVMGSGTSARISALLALGNQSTSNSSACSTGTEAVVDAALRIRRGLARRMVAGGAEGASPYTWSGFDSMRVLARKFNDRPEQGSRPLSASACGFVPGAGAGALLLEDLESALERGCRIYAEVSGVMVNCGGHRGGGSMTAPNPEGAQRCIRGALADAGIGADSVDAINGHLTATFADPHEMKNWSLALEKDPADFPYVNSTKSMIGHCLGAAGAIESVASVLELYKGFLHPSINCEDVHPEIAPYEASIVRDFKEMPELATMAKASFGFGDVNSCLILKKWTGA
ncbi:MAG TPA: beta-ketoacyl-[acyl-carrier-protein] synthase family protein [Desulfosalsimonadaceae bacterium]|nr:beta-ketoacyl-[acyl-carrier-protein] synthase family protein [Desulfosalsimonadaceae bacterium]